MRMIGKLGERLVSAFVPKIEATAQALVWEVRCYCRRPCPNCSNFLYYKTCFDSTYCGACRIVGTC